MNNFVRGLAMEWDICFSILGLILSGPHGFEWFSSFNWPITSSSVTVICSIEDWVLVVRWGVSGSWSNLEVEQKCLLKVSALSVGCIKIWPLNWIGGLVCCVWFSLLILLAILHHLPGGILLSLSCEHNFACSLVWNYAWMW